METTLNAFQGNCHCGANRYQIQLPECPSLVICDCSLCTKKGHVWIYDAEESLKITKGCTGETLTSYTASDTEALRHEFCNVCGTSLFGTHTSGVQAGKKGINFRVIVSAFQDVFIKGRSVVTIGPSATYLPYSGSLSFVEKASSSPPVEFRGTPPDAPGDDLTLYTGGCDCGAVQIALKTKSLSEVQIKEDNCSICVRNGFIGVYPHQSHVSIVGKDQTQDYQFGRKFNGSPFCRTCGVHCFGNLYGPPKEIIARLPEAKQEFVRKQLEVQPLNVRVLEGFEWGTVDIEWSNDGTEGYSVSD
ncbi:glutathione-dependent formaldehyde-activating enzyme [Colletotrichum orchidophilum]|uniref:Glutathione-dependent formaldehyde-activating enzyme n=1 Tax=Colletotrichum orchidophilum TaxID=1209926 RepID=A0A1G4BNJ2_9PEZI|nr:glutathione-dependent formaldehyde-activating enzyme [Colletotrichum orchidophilum]OHF02895.1 glutathione-dependent formaldehyde-activating enzyme [Colletotrichum orchidophilum]